MSTETLRLGSTAPNFKAETTQGPNDFHEFIGDNWVILFSHPEDYTPLCTTELGAFAKLERRRHPLAPVERLLTLRSGVRDADEHPLRQPPFGPQVPAFEAARLGARLVDDGVRGCGCRALGDLGLQRGYPRLLGGDGGTQVVLVLGARGGGAALAQNLERQVPAARLTPYSAELAPLLATLRGLAVLVAGLLVVLAAALAGAVTLAARMSAWTCASRSFCSR